SYRDSSETRFGDRRVYYALRAKFFHQSGENFEGRTCLRNILADDADARVTAHFFSQRFPHRLRKCNFAIRHRRASPLHRRSDLIPDSVKECRVRIATVDQPLRQYKNGITLRLPLLLFLFGAVVFAIDVADVMSTVAVGIALQECGAAACARALDEALSNFVDSAHILSVDARSLDTESGGASQDRAGGGLRVVRVFVI